MLDWNDIIVAAIAIVPTTATVIVGALQGRQSTKNSAKQSILMMILEDEFQYEVNGKLPSNYQNILHDFDAYTQAKGNSYVKSKVEAYEKWYANLAAREEDMGCKKKK